ncbi:hypothetical protein [Jeotgalibacillus campisalis]|uniref:Uncharacterized protein n=1 Tax=Jeotgalibacillus campisalis TaxID=220754 RepID=A0A0C2VQK3_9BACL|nr:hypothetical protein [Jeotgalibacillus campisalis]KIL51192.1 hypothetical protein KR50_10730 [Jeotgalibacillus campisalis]
MTYTAKPQNWTVALIFFFTCVPLFFIIENQAGQVFWLYIVLLGAILLLGLLRFRISVEPHSLHYSILLLSAKLYQVSIPPEKIKRLSFCRFGWTSKGVIIGLQKGFSIRIVRFSDDAIQALDAFARDHQLPIQKTDEYRSLEK